MRWIEDAVQKGRDHGAGFDDLLPVSLVKDNVEEQMRETDRLQEEIRKKEAEGKHDCMQMCFNCLL